MKSLATVLAILALSIEPAPAQWSPALSFNVRAAFPTGTGAVETTGRLSCSTGQDGVCLDGTIGFDWGGPSTGVYDLTDLDVGYSAAFGAQRRTSVVLRLGVSTWIHNDKTGAAGVNAGLAFRHQTRPRKAWRADVNWRRLSEHWRRSPWFTWPSLTVGLEWGRPPSN